LSVKKVAVTTSGIMILTLNSSGSFSLALRGIAHRGGGALVARNSIWKLPGSALRTGLRLGLGSNCPAAISRGKDKAKLYFTVLMITQH
jgi:hypothetical protein